MKIEQRYTREDGETEGWGNIVYLWPEKVSSWFEGGWTKMTLTSPEGEKLQFRVAK